jgi:hypothetical protein
MFWSLHVVLHVMLTWHALVSYVDATVPVAPFNYVDQFNSIRFICDWREPFANRDIRNCPRI